MLLLGFEGKPPPPAGKQAKPARHKRVFRHDLERGIMSLALLIDERVLTVKRMSLPPSLPLSVANLSNQQL